MKKYKVAFWVSTGAIFLFESVLSALTWNSEMSRQGIMSLGYPEYFIPMLTAFKVLGGLVLIIPQAPRRVKEWAYAGFGIDFICAAISIWAVGGFSVAVLFPVAVFAVLAVSYISYHKLNDRIVG